jgi:hypothetical protein
MSGDKEIEQVLQEYLCDDVIYIIKQYDNSHHYYRINIIDNDVCCDDDHCCNCGCWIMSIIMIGVPIGIITFVVWVFLS